MLRAVFISSCVSFAVSVALLCAAFRITLHWSQISSLSSIVLPDYAGHIAVEWDMALYRFFILSLLLLQGLAVFVLRRRLAGTADPRQNRDQPPAQAAKSLAWPQRIVDLTVGVLIVCALWLTDYNGAVAQIYASDRLHHTDTFIGAPGWAAVSGVRLCVDTFSQYGLGMPQVIGRLAVALGGFNYEHLLMVIVGMAALYLVALYFFLRDWLGSAAAAILGVLLALKWNMFWPGPSDFFVWKYPSGTVVRYFGDIFFFWCVMRHARSGSWWWALGAAAVNMAAFFYVSDSGLYLWVALLGYWAAYLFHCGEWRKAGRWVVVAVPLIVVIPAFLNKVFWSNLTEYIQLALGFFEGIKIQDVVTAANAGPLALGAAMVTVYSLTLLTTGSLCLLRRIPREKLVLVPLGCYGLCIFQYFIFRSAPENIYVVSIPFILIVAALLRWALAAYFPRQGIIVMAALCMITGAILVSSPAWQRYPNILNHRGNIFSDVKAGFREHMDIDQDAALIDRWTARHEQVALVSSFEAFLLMRADRRPYFYYFPLVTPGEFYMLDFYGMKMYTRPMFKRIMEQLARHPPARIFIEKKFVTGQLPLVYYEKFPSLLVVVSYIRAHYAPLAQGKYLVAMQYQG